MPKCKLCELQFAFRAAIDGKIKNLANRKYCLSCSPFGKHNTKQLESTRPDALEQRKCIHCSREFIFSRSAGHRASQCNTCIQRKRRARASELILQILGDKCWVCGYSKAKTALHAHHIDPAEKEFSVGGAEGLSFKRIAAERQKCALLCANCHGEVHENLIRCPTSNPARQGAPRFELNTPEGA